MLSPVDGLHSVWRHEVEADCDAVAHHGAWHGAVLCSKQQQKSGSSIVEGYDSSGSTIACITVRNITVAHHGARHTAVLCSK
jgi:hypothetical protein